MAQAQKQFSLFCKYGHISPRYSRGECVECCSIKEKKRRVDPAYKKRMRSYFKKWRKTKTGKRAITHFHLKRLYGLTIKDFEEMVERQFNCCAVCGKNGVDEKHGRLSVDHDHKTGKIRELLCDNCNGGIGKFQDNQSLLFKAIIYLRK